MNGDLICLVHLSGRLSKHPYHAACCLMEASSAGSEVHSKLTRLLGEFLPSVGLEGSRISLRSTVRVSFVNRAKTVACGYIGNILNRIGLQH